MSLNAGYEYFMGLCTLPDTHVLTHKHIQYTPHLTVGAMKCRDTVKIKYRGNKQRCSEKINLTPTLQKEHKSYCVLYFTHNYEEMTAVFLALQPSTISGVDTIITLNSLLSLQISYL